MPNTLERMTRKPKRTGPPEPNVPAANQPTTKTDATKAVRIERDLADQASVIALAKHVDVSDVLSPILRPELRKLYIDALETLRKRQEQEPE